VTVGVDDGKLDFRVSDQQPAAAVAAQGGAGQRA
jgi:hypothetical protein